jgi:hypothetical protein
MANKISLELLPHNKPDTEEECDPGEVDLEIEYESPERDIGFYGGYSLAEEPPTECPDCGYKYDSYEYKQMLTSAEEKAAHFEPDFEEPDRD